MSDEGLAGSFAEHDAGPGRDLSTIVALGSGWQPDDSSIDAMVVGMKESRQQGRIGQVKTQVRCTQV